MCPASPSHARSVCAWRRRPAVVVKGLAAGPGSQGDQRFLASHALFSFFPLPPGTAATTSALSIAITTAYSRRPRDCVILAFIASRSSTSAFTAFLDRIASSSRSRSRLPLILIACLIAPIHCIRLASSPSRFSCPPSYVASGRSVGQSAAPRVLFPHYRSSLCRACHFHLVDRSSIGPAGFE